MLAFFGCSFGVKGMGKLLYISEKQQSASEDQLVTLADLERFREKMLTDIKILLNANLGAPAKRWLKSHQVRKLLNISGGTLQTLRDNGVIPFTKIGGLIYYDAAEIDQTLTRLKKAS
jgi:Helix-turn-helix domain